MYTSSTNRDIGFAPMQHKIVLWCILKLRPLVHFLPSADTCLHYWITSPFTIVQRFLVQSAARIAYEWLFCSISSLLANTICSPVSWIKKEPMCRTKYEIKLYLCVQHGFACIGFHLVLGFGVFCFCFATTFCIHAASSWAVCDCCPWVSANGLD